MREQLTDDQAVKEDLLALQMQLELGEIDDEEYVEREAALMQRLRDVRHWREQFGMGTSGGPVQVRRARPCRRRDETPDVAENLAAAPESTRRGARTRTRRRGGIASPEGARRSSSTSTGSDRGRRAAPASAARHPARPSVAGPAMLDSLLTLGSRWTLVGGKGGVGKTTTAAALARGARRRGGAGARRSRWTRRTPSATPWASALGRGAGAGARGGGAGGDGGRRGPRARALPAYAPRRRSSRCIERGTYLERADVEGFARPRRARAWTSWRRSSACMELAGDAARRRGDRHRPHRPHPPAPRPPAARARLAGARCEAMEEKHRRSSLALAGAYRPDEAARLLEELDARAGPRSTRCCATPTRTRFVLVTTPEPVVLAETRRYRAALEARGIGLAGIVVNRSQARRGAGGAGRGMVFVPPLGPEPDGLEGLRRFAAAAAAEPAARPRRRPRRRPLRTAVGAPSGPPSTAGSTWWAARAGWGVHRLLKRVCPTSQIRHRTLPDSFRIQLLQPVIPIAAI